MKKTLDHFPRLKVLLKSVYYRLQGEPPLSYSGISKELIRECVSKEDPTILEIGCNDGGHTLWFAEMFENPRIYCFEPDPRAIARFKSNIGQHSNINLFEIALSDHNGEVNFYQSGSHKNEERAEERPEGWDLSGSVRKPKEHLVEYPWIKFDQKITVTASTLDNWCREHDIGTIDFIWMDVQGAEIDVFRGGLNTLANTRYIYTEYNDRELYEGQLNLRGLVKYLKNFKVIIRYPGDVLLGNKQHVGKPNKALQRMLVNSLR